MFCSLCTSVNAIPEMLMLHVSHVATCVTALWASPEWCLHELNSKHFVPGPPLCWAFCPEPEVLWCRRVLGSVWALGWAPCQSLAWSPVGHYGRTVGYNSFINITSSSWLYRVCQWTSTCWVWGSPGGCWAQCQPPVGWTSWCWRSVWLSSPGGPMWRCWCSSEGLAGRFYLMLTRHEEKMEINKMTENQCLLNHVYSLSSSLYYLVFPGATFVSQKFVEHDDLSTCALRNWTFLRIYSPCCFENIFFCLCSFGRLSMTGLKNVT